MSELKAFQYGSRTAGREDLIKYVRSMDWDAYQRELIDEGRGHADIFYAIQLFLTEVSSVQDTDAPPYKVRLSNGVEFAQLDTNVVGAYDPETAKLTIRRTQTLERAQAVIGLDGTPTPSLWKGRLGVDDLDVQRVLCTECRQRYVDDILGYDLIQTSRYTKPYSSLAGGRLNYDKTRGLLHEFCRRSSGDVGLITTKTALDAVLDHDDANEVPIDPDDQANWYGRLRGSNQFAGADIDVGVVLGSRHPRSEMLRQLAGLNGVAYESERKERSKAGHTFTETVPTQGAAYLHHFREHSIAQAIFRFGRRDGATVYVHTAAMPDWLQEIASTAVIEKRSDGEQAVWQALETLEEGTTSDFATEVDVVQRSQVRKLLNKLYEEGVVQKGGTNHRTIWTARQSPGSPTARVIYPAADD